MRKISDTVSIVIMGGIFLGTFVAVGMTSVAKRAHLTGPPEKPVWLDRKAFQERLDKLNK